MALDNLILKRENFQMELPEKLNSVYHQIRKSEKIINSKQYGGTKVTKEVWQQSMKFLALYLRKIFREYGKIIESPKITSCFDGSIDLYFETKKGERMLINIKNEGPTSKKDDFGDWNWERSHSKINYYGEKRSEGRKENTIKNTITYNPKETEKSLKSWMAKNLSIN